ncbi:MAG TPA: M15 family metallopeptidase [Microthrixaceae bacterium]|nr:M15 family metallopeptidase [Microthrixaceae bacterium]HNI34892.1 M15 family metallopeptidase [Microthrixaceae bacterium]
MTIPVDVQARINAIVSRFEPATVSTGTFASTSSTSASGAAFDSVLADALGAAGQLGASSTSSGDTSAGLPIGLLAGLTSGSADASIGRVTLGRTTASMSVGDASRAYAASSPTIASSRAVANLEGLYENGRLPDEALTSIGIGSHRLSPPAASAFLKLRSAAEAEGVDIGVTDSYRSYDAQVDVARRKGLYSQGGLAAKPGTSAHGLGLALDLDLDSSALAWMRANAGRFGFVEDTPRESWHWKFNGV